MWQGSVANVQDLKIADEVSVAVVMVSPTLVGSHLSIDAAAVAMHGGHNLSVPSAVCFNSVHLGRRINDENI